MASHTVGCGTVLLVTGLCSRCVSGYLCPQPGMAGQVVFRQGVGCLGLSRSRAALLTKLLRFGVIPCQLHGDRG